MSQPSADRNLLFGILAMQMDFISRDALILAMNSWVLDKKTSLGEILLKHKAIQPDSHALLDALVQKHLAIHGNDPEKSLAAISSATSVRKDLANITDAEVQASLIHVAGPARGKEGRGHDPYATVAPSVTTTTADGLRFRVLRPHARGGLGAVFVAQDEELHREVALKEIQDRHADNLESRSRFLLEAEITGGLEHPGIVPVYGLGTYADGRPYYAMRFIRGDSLKEAVDRFHKAEASEMSPGQRTLELRSLLGRFVDVCNAIAYAHSRGILHRDLKPGNIMLGKYGETLVVDWGLAKPVGASEKTEVNEAGERSLIPSSLSNSSQTMMGSAVGTPQYMSPEQAAGKLDEMGPASDVYSLGATLFCVLTGKPPIEDTDIGAILRRVQKGEFPRPRQVKSDVPPALEAICLKAMALKPADRYATPRTLAGDIEHWLADEPVSAWPEPWTVKARRWIGRHRTLATSVASTVVVAVVGLALATVLLTAANERERIARTEAVKEKEKAVEAKKHAEAMEAVAVAQKAVAEAQEAEAKKQKEIAEQNFKLARKAVDRYHTEVSEDVLLNQPGMEPLRKKLLEAASEFYDKFVKQRSNDPSMKADLGMALFRLAKITGDIGSEADAIKLHERAIKEFESLTKAQSTLEIDADLAAALDDLGRLYRKTEQNAKAESALQQALVIWERLLGRAARSGYQAGLAQSQLRLGNVRQNLRDLDSAKKLYEQSMANWKTLADTHQKTPMYRRYEAQAHNNLALVFRFLGKAKESQQEYVQAEEILAKLVEKNPTVAMFKNDLARTKWSLGELFAQYNQPNADASFKEAAQLWEGLVDRHPAHTEYHILLADCYLSTARMYRKEPEKAVEFSTKALTRINLASENTDAPDHQASLSRIYGSIGDSYRLAGILDKAETTYGKGLLILDNLINTKPNLPRYRGDKARVYNSLGLLFDKQTKEDKALAEFTKALTLWETLVKENPRDYAVDLNITMTNLVKAARTGKKLDEAVGWCTRSLDALKAADDKTAKLPLVKDINADLFLRRADLQTQLGQHDKALPDWDSALAMCQTGATAYRGAQLLALAAAKSEKNKDQAEGLASRSIRFLNSAREFAYFKSADNLKRLRADPELQALRDRADFKKLLGTVESAP